ncbi:MAG: hypothetical protein ACKV2O_01005 [Acidimicrobiales bacterium]
MDRTRRPVLATASAVLLGVLLSAAVGACSASSTNFRSAAEKVITDDIATQGNLGDLKATCDEPASTEIDEKFQCTAETADGEVIAFDATIAEDDTVNVESTNLITPDGLKQIEEIAVKALESQIGATLGLENFDCGQDAVVIDVSAEVLTCVLTEPDSGLKYEAKVDIPDLNDPGKLSVEVAEMPLEDQG